MKSEEIADEQSRDEGVRRDYIDTGLSSLCLIAAVLGQRIDIDRLRHEHLQPGSFATVDDVVRIAKSEGLKSRLIKSDRNRLLKTPLPAIGRDYDGEFFVVARASESHVLLARIGAPPLEVELDRFLKFWSGDLILLTKREALVGDTMRFGLAWFLPVVQRYQKILAEVLFVSALIQIIALVSPLFFQVVIDKVLVHRGLTTLQVLIIALCVVHVADVSLNWLRTYTFAHTASRMDAILGAHLFKHLLALPIAYFESRATGQIVARVRELENIRHFVTSSALTLAIDVVFSVIFLAGHGSLQLAADNCRHHFDPLLCDYFSSDYPRPRSEGQREIPIWGYQSVVFG